MTDKASKHITNNAAVLWDESFLWGIMAYRALKKAGLPCDLIRAKDIQAGVLDNYKMLFVPGGWASNKAKALGEEGIKAIQDFVDSGGNYLGFCGGAGLATKGKGCIGLLNVKRRPTQERVPSFSGRIKLNINEHPIWNGKPIPDPQPLTPVFNAWWPSQFIVEDETVEVLARYGAAMPDAFSSDLNVEDVQANSSWAELEGIYRINLDPARLLNEPAVIAGRYGKGKVVLSLVHFDTPDDEDGQQVLVNLWEYLTLSKGGGRIEIQDSKFKIQKPDLQTLSTELSDLVTAVTGLIALGERNFLWFWRNSMLLQWRRGVRGLEYNTLYIMIKEIAELLSKNRDVTQYISALEKINTLLRLFIEKAGQLLILERLAMQKGPITYERCDDTKIQTLRQELFSESKSHGGMFKEVLDEMDEMLFVLLTGKRKMQVL